MRLSLPEDEVIGYCSLSSKNNKVTILSMKIKGCIHKGNKNKRTGKKRHCRFFIPNYKSKFWNQTMIK